MNNYPRHIIKGSYRELKKQLKKLSPHFDAEAIHYFRVTYKKLRAILRMLSAGEKITVSKKIKAYYRSCGTLRDLQLQQLRIKKACKKYHQKPSAYLNLLKAAIKNIQQHLKETISSVPVDKNRQTNIEKAPASFSKKAYSNYIKQKWQSAATLSASGQLNGEQLHTVRKTLKDIFYTLAALPKERHNILSNSLAKKINWKHLNHLLEKLGHFQDQSVAINFLNSVTLKKLPVEERQLLMKVKAGWIKEQQLLKQTLIRKLQIDLDIK